MSRLLRFLPLALLLLLFAALAWRLARPSDERVSSAMVGKPLPAVTLEAAVAGTPAPDFDNGPRYINLFASWCVPCIAEAPVLLELKRQGVPIDGVAVRDAPGDIAAFLREHGNPYAGIGADRDSRVQMLLGASGVPETFLVDAHGNIVSQHIGPIEPGEIAKMRRSWEALRK